MDSATIFEQTAQGRVHAEIVLAGDDERVIVTRSEAELQAQFAQLARAGWELRRTVEGPDREDGVTHLTLEFAQPRL